MPYNTGAAVSAHRADGFADCFGHREVLVRLGDAHVQPVRGVIERGKVALELDKAHRVEYAPDEVFEGQADVIIFVRLVHLDRAPVVVDVPRRHVVVRGEGGSVLGVEAVAGDNDVSEAESHRELRNIGLELVKCLLRRGPSGGLFQFKERDRQAVDVANDVETPLVFEAAYGDLVDCLEVVLFPVGGHEVDGGVSPLAVEVVVLNAGVSAHENLVDAHVFSSGVLRLRGEQLADGLLQEFLRHARVEVSDGLVEGAPQDDAFPGFALAGTGCNVGAVEQLPVVLTQLFQSHLLQHVFAIHRCLLLLTLPRACRRPPHRRQLLRPRRR